MGGLEAEMVLSVPAACGGFGLGRLGVLSKHPTVSTRFQCVGDALFCFWKPWPREVFF